MRTMLAFALAFLLVGVSVPAQRPNATGSTRFVLDGNRIYAESGFVRSDGSIHMALLFVDTGSPSLTLRESLIQDLHLNQNAPLVFDIGGLSVEVPRGDVIGEAREPSSIGSGLKVEGVLPAGILQRYQVVIDYQARTLTLAKPRTLTPKGIAVPFRIKQETGLIAVNAVIDDIPSWITIDTGSAYTWFRQSAAKRWRAMHPDWEHGVGAVGASNMMMSGDTTETAGALLRIPDVFLGRLHLKNVGVLAAGSGRSPIAGLDFFDWYAEKNAVPVIGWIGGNVLKQFQITIDYPTRMMYWMKQDAPEAQLNQVGLTLRSEDDTYLVAAIASKNGRPTIMGVLPGDQLIQVGRLELRGASWGAIYAAMGGTAGDTRSLILERNGRRFTVAATIVAFDRP